MWLSQLFKSSMSRFVGEKSDRNAGRGLRLSLSELPAQCWATGDAQGCLDLYATGRLSALRLQETGVHGGLVAYASRPTTPVRVNPLTFL